MKERLKEKTSTQPNSPLLNPVVSAQNDTSHTFFRADSFWKKIPAYKNVDESEFFDHLFQTKHSITNQKGMIEFLDQVADPAFVRDVKSGLLSAPMNMRVSPYLLSLINWDAPYDDPIRTQFIPVNSTREIDHPQLQLDSLHEQIDSPVPGLVHRYNDKALFLPLDVCPVYCRFCTRSYAIGNDTDSVKKVNFGSNVKKWKVVFEYLATHPEIEDVVVSGGDAYLLAPQLLKLIGDSLLDIPSIRRIRFASKGPAVMPMKILTDHKWTDTLTDIVTKGRHLNKEVCLHTHFNSVNEITNITKQAMDILFQRGIKVRNQSVLIRGVNDSPEKMIALVKKLSYMNIQPYYVYQHDMVKGVEELRTSVQETLEIEKQVRGSTAGFNTPTFVVDAPGGGGKRCAHSFEHYNKQTGISVYKSPSVNKEKTYLYFDPISSLSDTYKELWKQPSTQQDMIDMALKNVPS
ncbi:KamA family radical SAM protein [Candidatus Marinamargulisbacteria bacterium SCGC AAA071-K20]|nr:KamA family radical SAM protein [Candidatus Marinamargulisbacteria bacterium SCGC AAA071-K20]